MARDARNVGVTIIRSQTDEVPEEVGIGIAILAKIIAKRIREEDGEAGNEIRTAETMLRVRLSEPGDKT